MEPVCDDCQAAGRPPALEGRAPVGRCVACGGPLDLVDERTEEGPPPQPPHAGGGVLLLRCQGRTWRIAGLDELRRWIVEHRVAAWDLLSEDGVRWTPVDRRPALGDLLRVVERLDGPRARRPTGLREASPPEAGWASTPEPEGAAPAPRD